MPSIEPNLKRRRTDQEYFRLLLMTSDELRYLEKFCIEEAARLQSLASKLGREYKKRRRSARKQEVFHESERQS